MERIKAENNALIFVNKELGRMNDELTEELQLRTRRSSENEATNRPKKKIKKPKTTVVEETDEEAARVCKYDKLLFSKDFIESLLIFFL